jgi:hypothetical protein
MPPVPPVPSVPLAPRVSPGARDAAATTLRTLSLSAAVGGVVLTGLVTGVLAVETAGQQGGSVPTGPAVQAPATGPTVQAPAGGVEPAGTTSGSDAP